MGSFAIVHQRSMFSVIISENSSLLLIVWNDLKASGSFSFGWFPAHSNTEKMFQVHIKRKKKKKYKKCTEPGQSCGGEGVGSEGLAALGLIPLCCILSQLQFLSLQSEKAPLLYGRPAHVMSLLKWLCTASLNAMLEAGCLQALAQGCLVTM